MFIVGSQELVIYYPLDTDSFKNLYEFIGIENDYVDIVIDDEEDYYPLNIVYPWSPLNTNSGNIPSQIGNSNVYVD